MQEYRSRTPGAELPEQIGLDQGGFVVEHEPKPSTNKTRARQFFSVTEAARLTGQHRDTITRACREGRLPARGGHGRPWAIATADLMQYSRTQPAAGPRRQGIIPENIAPETLDWGAATAIAARQLRWAEANLIGTGYSGNEEYEQGPRQSARSSDRMSDQVLDAVKRANPSVALELSVADYVHTADTLPRRSRAIKKLIAEAKVLPGDVMTREETNSVSEIGGDESSGDMGMATESERAIAGDWADTVAAIGADFDAVAHLDGAHNDGDDLMVA